MSNVAGKKMHYWVLWIVVLVAGLAIAAATAFLYQANQYKTELAGLIRADPKTAAVVAYTLDEHGQPVMDGSEVFYNADTPLVMASSMKTVILAAYEAAVERGELNPNESIVIVDLEKYYLPKTDGGAHAAGLASLGLAADADGVHIGQDDLPLAAARRVVARSPSLSKWYSRWPTERLNERPSE